MVLLHAYDKEKVFIMLSTENVDVFLIVAIITEQAFS